MKRTATAHWEGTVKEGKGHLTTQSQILNETDYSFHSRFDDHVGTNPEELIGAAHAGCFTMHLSGELSKAGHTNINLDTTAVVEFDTSKGQIANITLNLHSAAIDGVDLAQFTEIANFSKANCPISKALSAVPMVLNISYA